MFKSHDDYRSYRGEAQRDGIAESLLQTFISDETTGEQRAHNGVGFVGELVDTSKVSEEEQTHRDDHVRINHDAESHEIENRDVSQCYRRKPDQPEDDTSSREELQRMPKKEYPWTAPRVLARYLALRTTTTKPTVCSIDDYDGMESWEGEG